MGLASEAFGFVGSVSGFWALAGGVSSFFLARSFFAFQRKDLDSSINKEDILFEKAEVIVPIEEGKTGKIRVQLGQGVTERYAQVKKGEGPFQVGDLVQVAEVTEDTLYVQHWEGK